MISLTGGKSSRLQMTGDNDGNYNWRWKHTLLGEHYEDSSEEAVNEYEEMQMHIGIILINIKTKREVG